MRTRRHEVSDAVDIGLVGVPFDIGVNYRSGARQGPAGVREASRVIRRVHPSSLIKPFEICNVADLGDAPVNPMSKERSIEMIEAFFADLRCHGIVPIAIGGDHTIPLPILRALAGDRPVGVLHFDAHADTLDELCGDRINHARSCVGDTRRDWSIRRGSFRSGCAAAASTSTTSGTATTPASRSSPWTSTKRWAGRR